jgi:hypothetical protein
LSGGRDLAEANAAIWRGRSERLAAFEDRGGVG